jgi:microcompartment protein CcmK/EutM
MKPAVRSDAGKAGAPQEKAAPRFTSTSTRIDRMLIARVTGLVVATMKHESLVGSKLLIVRETDVTGKMVGRPMVAVDAVDAGEGDVVLVTQGSGARQTDITLDRPVDNIIMAIVDTLQADGEVTFRKQR